MDLDLRESNHHMDSVAVKREIGCNMLAIPKALFKLMQLCSLDRYHPIILNNTVSSPNILKRRFSIWITLTILLKLFEC
jgi:hypothetical protein